MCGGLFNTLCSLLCCLIMTVGVALAFIIVFVIITIVALNPCLLQLDTSCLDECIPILLELAAIAGGGGSGDPFPPYNVNNTFLNTRTVPVSSADAWTNVNAVSSWNIWGLAPIIAVTGATTITDINCTLLDIFWYRAFQWREFSDMHMKATVNNATLLNQNNFFAFSGFEEAFGFGSATCQCITTQDGFTDYQDRIFRASQYSGTNVSLLYNGFNYYIGTKNAFPQFDGTQSATAAGLILITTHQPFAYGFQTFTADSSGSFDDEISLKGLLWAFWKNQDNSKGVIGVLTHYGSIPNQTMELDDMVISLSAYFSGQVTSLDVYILGDFNTNSVQLRGDSSVLTNMDFLTNGTGGTDISRTTSNEAIDSIWGGTYLGAGAFGPLVGVNTSAANIPIPGWTVGVNPPAPDPYTDLSDHTLLIATVQTL